MGADLGRLLERCRRGDDRAWRALVDATSRLVYSVVRRHGLHTDDAEDAFAATYQALYGQLDRLDAGEAIPRWLAVTASRQAMRLRRSSPRGASAIEPEDLDSLVAQEDRQALELALDAERAVAVRQGLEAIGGKCQQLLSLLFLEELDYNELAAKMNMPVGSIGPTRVRCLEKLRRALSATELFSDE